MTTPAPSPPLPVKRTHDEEPRRATCGVHYPQGEANELVFQEKSDLTTKLPALEPNHTKRRVVAKRVSIKLTLRSFEDISFHECNFHDRQGQGAAHIEKVTFRRCDFHRTFFGTTDFHQVRFIDCTFEQCDFSHDEFRECSFERCTFTRCSAIQALFHRTEVDPRAFLAGIAFPDYNLTDKTESLRHALHREWLHIRLRLAEQLFRSNSDLLHSQHSDTGLLELKRISHVFLIDLWRHGTSNYAAQPLTVWHAALNDPAGPFRMFGRYAVLLLTAGGTSIRNLAIVLLLLAAIYPFVLSSLSITYNATPCALVGNGHPVAQYVRLFLLSISLLLGFGFTAFSPTGLLATLALVGGSTFGVFWYALLIPVLVRRVYR